VRRREERSVYASITLSRDRSSTAIAAQPREEHQHHRRSDARAACGRTHSPKDPLEPASPELWRREQRGGISTDPPAPSHEVVLLFGLAQNGPRAVTKRDSRRGAWSSDASGSKACAPHGGVSTARKHERGRPDSAALLRLSDRLLRETMLPSEWEWRREARECGRGGRQCSGCICMSASEPSSEDDDCSGVGRTSARNEPRRERSTLCHSSWAASAGAVVDDRFSKS